MDGPPRPVLVRVVNRVVIPVHARWALLLGLLSLASPRLGFSRSPNERGIIHSLDPTLTISLDEYTPSPPPSASRKGLK
jgi:hypothetical protein